MEKLGLDGILEPYLELMGIELLIDLNLSNFVCRKCQQKIEMLAREKSQISRIQEHLGGISSRNLIKTIKKEELEIVDVGIDGDFLESPELETMDQIKLEDPEEASELIVTKAIETKQPRELVCDYCGYHTARRYCMENHMQCRHRKFLDEQLQCNLCDKQFLSVLSLRSHKRFKHEGRILLKFYL
jgi:protein-arginine kinase activator protein McsA